MNIDSPKVWLGLRLLTISANIFFIGLYPRANTNLDWFAAGLIGLLVGGAIFLWLCAIRSRQYVDWSKPLSWTVRFLPMNQYPLRSFEVGAWGLVAGGLTAMVIDMRHQHFSLAFGGTFLAMGAAMAASIRIWIRIFLKNSGQ